MTESEISLQNSAAAYISWGRTIDRAARTAKGRNAFESKFLAEANGDSLRAKALRKAYFKQLALKSVQARQRRKNGAA